MRAMVIGAVALCFAAGCASSGKQRVSVIGTDPEVGYDEPDDTPKREEPKLAERTPLREPLTLGEESGRGGAGELYAQAPPAGQGEPEQPSPGRTAKERCGNLPRLGAKAPVASASFGGTVADVSACQVEVLDEEGNVYELWIDNRSRIVDEQGQSISAESLKEGTPIQASFDLIDGHTFARDLEVGKKASAGEEQNEMLMDIEGDTQGTSASTGGDVQLL